MARPCRPLVSLLLCSSIAATACSGADEDVLVARKLPAEIQEDATAVVSTNNQFACALHAKLGNGGNSFFSPFTTTTLLAMVEAGARGATRDEIHGLLGAALPEERFHAANAALLDSLDVGRGFGGYTLETANGLFGQKGLAFLPDFIARIAEDYGADLLQVDFADDLNGAFSAINDWVSARTAGRIQELFGPESLSTATRLALASTILFKGKWKEPFVRGLTDGNAAFHRVDGTTARVAMMRRKAPLEGTSIPGGRMAVLPFEGEDLSLILLRPDTVDGLSALEAELSGAALEEWLGSVRTSSEPIELGLPRFEIQSKFGLEGILMSLGIESAFDPARADFSGIDGRRDLHLSTILHQANIAVDEEGAEAAAATGADVNISAGRTFTLDRPFAFLILDQVTGSILFMGRLVDPSSS